MPACGLHSIEKQIRQWQEGAAAATTAHFAVRAGVRNVAVVPVPLPAAAGLPAAAAALPLPLALQAHAAGFHMQAGMPPCLRTCRHMQRGPRMASRHATALSLWYCGRRYKRMRPPGLWAVEAACEGRHANHLSTCTQNPIVQPTCCLPPVRTTCQPCSPSQFATVPSPLAITGPPYAAQSSRCGRTLPCPCTQDFAVKRRGCCEARLSSCIGRINGQSASGNQAAPAAVTHASSQNRASCTGRIHVPAQAEVVSN